MASAQFILERPRLLKNHVQNYRGLVTTLQAILSMVVAAPTWQRCLSLLQRCSTLRHLQSIHAFFITSGLLLPATAATSATTFALSRLILAACSLNDLPYASLLFRHSPAPPNSFIFNTLIRAYSRSPQPHRSLSYFLLMLRSPAAAPPDHHTFPFALSACAAVSSLSSGEQIHCLVVKNGLSFADPFIQTALLRLYIQARDINDDNLHHARILFDEIPQQDPVHFDVLMNAYLHGGSPEKALQLFGNMLRAGLSPDAHTIATALTACSHAGALDQGVWIHKHLLRDKMLQDTYIASALINMYAKCGSIGKAVEVFKSVPERNTFTWSAMIGGFAMHGLAKEAIDCLSRMLEEGMRPDGVVVLGALAACAHAGLVKEGLHLLAQMESRYSVAPQHEHYSCAVDMLCRVGRLKDAVELIHKMPMKPLASVWGSLLTGCRIYGNVELAELAVRELQGLTSEGGDDEGVYVQLSNIYMNADKPEEARRVRKMIGSRGIKKTPAWSSIDVEGVVSSFIAGDQVHPLRLEIGRMLVLLTEDMSFLSTKDQEKEEHIIDFEFMCLE